MKKSILSKTTEKYTNEVLGKLLERIIELQLRTDSSLNQLVISAKSGGGITPEISYERMRKWRKRYGKKLRLKCYRKNIKQCKLGPCRYGAKQGLKCFELLEKADNRRKKRKQFRELLIKSKGFSEKALREFLRKDLLMVCSIVGSNIKKLLKKKGQGNEPLIQSILKKQERFIKKQTPLLPLLLEDNKEGSPPNGPIVKEEKEK